VTGAFATRLAAAALRRQKCAPERLAMRSAAFTALIIATALFMENMDGTVISTSLPAIALDLHQDPIVLKLALTSYMLTLAVFIPASGWVADRFGARTVFCSASSSRSARSYAALRPRSRLLSPRVCSRGWAER
jgi:hypothetical protein